MKSKNYFLARAAMTLLFALLCSVGTWADGLKIIVGPTNGTTTVIGDINGDGEVDGNDVQEIVKFIMQDPQATTDMSKVDINCDNLVNAADIVTLTNIINSATEIVYVSGEGETFAFQVETSKAYNVATTAAWITIDPEAKDGQHYVTVAMNPSTEQRMGIVTVTSTDGTLSNSLTIVQAGKEDGRYIDIDWEKATLDSYDPETGVAVITFADEVPIMGEYDVVMLPDEVGNLIIRVIEEVTEVAGKTVTLKTMEGDMGNLFRDQEFAFEFGGEGTASARGVSGSKPVFRPEKVEIFEDGKYVEIYNANIANTRGTRSLDTGDLTISYEGSDKKLWSLSDRGSITLKKGVLQVAMKGTIEYAFKKEPWYKVWKSSATKANVILEGNWDSDVLYSVVTNTAAEINYDNSTSYDDDDVLKANALKQRYTFKVGEIPVQVVVDGDVKCSYQANLMGVGNITSGLKVGKHFKYGIKVNTQTEPEFVSEDVIDRSRTSLSYPQAFIGNPDYLNSNCIGGLTVYPDITIGFYGIGSRTFFRPVEQLNLRAQSWEANHATNPGEKAERVRVSRLTDVHILMRDIPSRLLELSYVYGKHISNLDEEGHAETLVEYPEYARITPDDTNLMEGDEQELEVTAFHHNNVTGEELPTELAWVDFDVVGSGNNKIVKKTDEYGKGKIKLKFTKGSTLEEKVKYRLYTKRGEYKEGVWTSKLLAYNIKCETPSQEVEKGAENVPVTFLLQKAVAGTVTPWANKRVEFIATNGTVSPRYNTTDANGNVKAFFTPTNDAPEGTVTAIVIEEGVKKDWEGRAVGTITVKGAPCDTGDDNLNKADQQDNSVVVNNKTTGATETCDFNVGKSEWKKTTDNIDFTAKITDQEGKMKGELGGFIPLTMIDLVNALTGTTFENSPGAKVMFYLQQGNTYVDGEFAKFSGQEVMGNLKPESKIMIRKPCNTKKKARTRGDGDEEEYTDEYEVLIYLVFQNQNWNNETHQMEPGDEFEIYGKCTMPMHTPKITRFQVSTEKDWVKVGESVKVNLDSYAEEGATWDWNDVEIVAQSPNYNDAYNGVDEGYFTWDATTQTLTSVKSCDNKYVYVYFGLKSNPEVKRSIQIATGEGWKYTMLKASKEEITDHANSYPSFSFDFAPKDSENEKIDFNALEIDPETNPDNYFSLQKTYGPQGWPIFVSSKTPPGEYTLRFWVKSNHDVNCTMKFIITPENEE